MKNSIKNIIVEEFSLLIKNIENDFEKNYKKKVNNFLLCEMDAQLTANMVFVSSFESKSGFAIEACAKRIARLRFGNECVPTIVNPYNLPCTLDESSLKGQLIVTNVNVNDGNLTGEIAAFRANNVSSGRGKCREESSVTQASIKTELLPLAKKYLNEQIFVKPVDLAFFDGKDWNICELKAGGDLDSSNAPSNVQKLLTAYIAMNTTNCNAYFATLYNKDGEGNTWKGAIKKHMNYPSMFLIGSQFWTRILPSNISFDDLTEIYADALKSLQLNARINEMIKKCISVK